MTDFRALCAELADSLEDWLSSNSIGGISLDDGTDAELIFRARAAQWGADQELEACCEWVRVNGHHWTLENRLRAVRRPKPPSLKQQAIDALYAVAIGANDTRELHQDLDTIRRALEALPDA